MYYTMIATKKQDKTVFNVVLYLRIKSVSKQQIKLLIKLHKP